MVAGSGQVSSGGEAQQLSSRFEIVLEAKNIVLAQTPFHHQAAVVGVGCDCIGVLRIIGRKVSPKESAELEASPEFLSYGPDPDPQLLLRGCRKFMDEIPKNQALPGDALLFKTLYSKGLPKHFGIVTRLDPMYMVHSWALGPGHVIENRVDERWQRRILSAWRFRGVDG